MDFLTVLLIVLAVIVVAAAVFFAVRRNQRSGSVLAAPANDRDTGARS